MKYNLKISFGSSRNGRVIKQDVSYVYAFSEKSPNGTYENNPSHYTKKDYDELYENENLVIAQNYTGNSDSAHYPSGISKQWKNFDYLYAFKREIWEGGGQPTYEPVLIKNDSNNNVFADYNIANDRWYEYVIQPAYTEETDGVIEGTKKIIRSKWQYWSLTELHPVIGDKKKFTASPKDVWVFKYNVSPSEQTQNFSKTQQDNLAQYPVFSIGKRNNVSSSISCLLGSEMAPYNFVTVKKVPKYNQDGTITWVNEMKGAETLGGYTERKLFSDRLTSNQKTDMLNMWREVAFSGNPKLIKDVKGQKFLVQITQSSNSVNDSWYRNPDTINFSFVEIGSLDGVTIIGEGDENETNNKNSTRC